MKIPQDRTWTRLVASNSRDGGDGYIEAEGFDEDRVPANEQLFLAEFGYWIAADYCVPEGAVGSMLEIFKLWIFITAGTRNHNYTTYLLE